jgi:hypothetical protein
MFVLMMTTMAKKKRAQLELVEPDKVSHRCQLHSIDLIMMVVCELPDAMRSRPRSNLS